MIPQLGFAEMIVLALLAIIVVGPKDLPKLMKSLGQLMAKIRSMGQEFKDAIEVIVTDEDITVIWDEINEIKKLGKLENKFDTGLSKELRALDKDIRDATDTSSPKGGAKSDTV